ncbi:MAG: family 43 glycosylhydrolase [Bacteroidaceae bacterium]|nr:family 43 glycosylhydrolase [Bacteroidaceae bacterium]
MKRLLCITICLLSMGAGAQNPIIRDQFTADPTARVFNNKVYLFPSHDIPAPAGQRQDWFCMEDYHVFSSENLTDWTDHGVILSQENVPWGKPDGYSMWAPDCVAKDGKYYFYYPNAPRGGRGFAVGVAIAEHPEGPYTPEKESIRGVMGIDPCVLIDDDGAAYLYWSGMGIRGGRLKENMTELKDGSLQMEGLPEGFKEGPFAFKRDGRYYLTFPWVRKENGTETLAYAMSDSPLGPWQFKGIIMAEHDNRCWTNHHSLVQYKGEWYLFYHRNHYSPGMDKRRSACIEKVSFNADGTIQEVKQTLRGVGLTQATSKIEVDRYSSAGDGVSIEFNDSTDTFQGWHATLANKGSWLRYNDVDFSSISAGYVSAKIKANANTYLTIHEGSAEGKLIAKLAINVETQRYDLRGKWVILTYALDEMPRGTTDLSIVCEGAEISIDWMQIKTAPLP